MATVRRNFMGGIMNKDLDERLIPDGQTRNALNVDIIHSESEGSGVAKNKKGNTIVSDLSTVTGIVSINNARTIGTVTSQSDNRLYWLVAADEFDGIFEYNEATGNTVRILQSNKATPSTISKLAFDQDYIVTGINYIEGFICWTDNLNEPRRIKIDRCKSYTVDDPRIDLDLRVIFGSPLRAPSITLIQEDGQENNIEDRFVQFSYRWKNKDNQYSAMSPFSATAFEPKDYEIDYGAGENKAMENEYNAVEIHFETGNSFVEEVQLLMRDSKSLNVSIVETFNKSDLGILNNNTETRRFSNNKIYSALESGQLGRLFDNVPLKAGSQEVIERRVVYGDYTQFHDIARADGSRIEIDYSVSFAYKALGVAQSPERTFRSDRDYEVGIEYGDADGRFSTALTSDKNTVYIPIENSITANSITVDINNDPPAFATNYRLVLKQSKKNYYNVFPILYYAEGPYRHFLVNDSEIDKLRVGEYVIFKADVDGPTLSDNKYKIIELKTNPDDFLSNGNSQIPGLYFKIKVDNSSDFNPNALFTFYNEGYGTNVRYPTFEPKVLPVVSRFSVAEKAIHYGDGNALGMSVVGGNVYNHWKDFRITIEVTAGNTFRYTGDISASGGWISGIPITGGVQSIAIGSSPVAFQVQFNTSYTLVVGDQWKVNCRSSTHLTGSIFSGTGGLPLAGTSISFGDWGGGAIVPSQGWSPTISPETDRPIEAGAIIKIQVIQDLLNVSNQDPVQQFPPSPRRYDNIEEWFIESGAYTQFKQYDNSGNLLNHSQGVIFRRGSTILNNTVQQSNGTYTSARYMNQGGAISPTTLNYPVHMIIQGFGYNGNDDNFIHVSFEIQQAETLAQCETKATETDINIFHESVKTYPIVNGRHKVLWDYQDYTTAVDGTSNTVLGQLVPGSPDTEGLIPHDFNIGDKVIVASTNINGAYTVTNVTDRYNITIDLTFPGSGPVTPGTVGMYHPSHFERDQSATLPAVLRIGNPLSDNSDFNAFTFGNGLESDRVLDDFNETTVEYSPRSTVEVDIYEQERKKSSLTYSGIYRSESSLNRLNEFNLSLSNFKNLEVEYGTVEKLHARDTNIVVFQEDKVSKILYGKNILSDSVGGGSVVSVPEVLGTQISYVGEWGISSNPESFASWGSSLFFTDAKRSSVLMMQGDNIQEIDKLGMTTYFRELLKNNPNTQKLGVYDAYSKQYIIASNENSSKPCDLSLSVSESTFPSNSSSDTGEVAEINKPTLTVYSNTDWSTGIVYSAGSGWVTGVPYSGFGDQGIFIAVAPNNTGSVRTATITFTYCDGQTATHTITQGAGSKIIITTWISDTKYQPE